MNEDLQHTQHQAAQQAVMGVLPDSELISYENSKNLQWETPEVRMPRPVLFAGTNICADCGDPYDQPGLVRRCQSRHTP